MNEDDGWLHHLPRKLRMAHRVASSWLASPVRANEAAAGTRRLLVGRAEAFDDQVLVSPFTQRRSIFWQVELEEYRRDMSGRGRWTTVLRRTSKASFWLVDDEGPRVRVDPGVVTVRLKTENVTEDPRVDDANAALAEYLERELGGSKTKTTEGTFSFYERLVVPGARIAVYGLVAHERVPVPGDGYRGGVGHRCLLRGTDREPIVLAAREPGRRDLGTRT
jgi:hypothetical protein